MKKAPNVKLGCKSCDPLLDNDWIDESGFTVKMQTNKVTNIVGEKKKKKSSKTVSLF